MDLYILIGSVISILVGVLPLFFVKRDIEAFVVAAAAYFTAIIVKAVIQYSFLSFFEKPQIPTYLAYGALTTATEPGFAYVFARLVKGDSQVYGVALAFWENAVLVGLLLLPDAFILNYTVVLTTLLQLIIIKIIDRTSSLLLHYSWGVTACLSHRKNNIKYIIVTAPFGFVDSIAAYADLNHLSLRPMFILFSIPVFTLSLLSFIVARKFLYS